MSCCRYRPQPHPMIPKPAPSSNHKPLREFSDSRWHKDYFLFWNDPQTTSIAHCRWHHFLDDKGKHICPPNCLPDDRPGVYEFALVHKRRQNVHPVPVYVGKAGGKGGMKERHEKYKKEDSNHIAHLFRLAQKNGCYIFRRYKYDNYHQGGKHGAGDILVTSIESRFLSYFDYAFNKQLNGKDRPLVLAERSSYGVPRGIYIITLDIHDQATRATSIFPPPAPGYNRPSYFI